MKTADAGKVLRDHLAAGALAKRRPNTGGEGAPAEVDLAPVGRITERGSKVQHFVIRAAPQPPSGPPVTFIFREPPRAPSGALVKLDVESINKTFGPKATPTEKGGRK